MQASLEKEKGDDVISSVRESPLSDRAKDDARH
jgi:hypothetical protein